MFVHKKILFAFFTCLIVSVSVCGQDWIFRNITNNMVSTPRPVFGPDGTLHASYIDWYNPGVNYCRLQNGTWAANPVSTIFSPTYADIGISQDNSPVIGFADADNNRVYMSSYNGGTWLTEQLPYNFHDICFPSTAFDVDKSNIAHLCFVNQDNALKYEVLHAWKSLSVSGPWQIETVEGLSIPQISKLDMDFDSQGNMYIVYYQSGVQKLAKKDSNGWTVNEIFAGQHLGQARIAIDENDNIHLALQRFISTYSRNMVYALYDGNSWTAQNIDTSYNTGWNFDIDHDSNGIPYVCYTDYGNRILKYAYLDGTTWRVSNVTSDVFYAQYENRPNGIVIDQNNYPHILYVNSHEGLSHATIPEPSIYTLSITGFLISLAYCWKKTSSNL